MASRPALARPTFVMPFLSARLRLAGSIALALALLAGLFALGLVLAQVTGDRGIAPTASSADIEVRGIKVDVRADSAEEARDEAWREAQRLAWKKAGGPAISDAQLNGLVSAIVIQQERLGPKRYIGTLGVIFDRQRASRFFGGANEARSSAPMLLIPVTASAGTFTAFEVRNPWQRAWAEFNPGTSRIDYVRPSGAGGDSLLLNFGQTGRRSRAWWRSTLDQYGAADVLVPVADLRYQFPGGPVTGTFVARYGPDSLVLGSFTMTAPSPAQLPEMLARAVERLDGVFEQALVDGKLRPDPTLRIGGSGEIDPALERLIEIGRAVRMAEAARAAAAANATTATPATDSTPGDQASPETPAPAARTLLVQFASPDAASFDAALSGVRGTPGVRSLSVTSTAMGGTSMMSVTYGGTLEELAAALRARGFNVRQGGNTLAISR